MNYKNGKIYQILNKQTNDVYVGSTCSPLCKRLSHHVIASKVKQGRTLYQLMNSIGTSLFYIELLENYPCENKEQLKQREGHYIRQIGNLNMCIAGRTNQEWKQENKEHIKAQTKDYYERTKEYQTERQKQDKVKAWKNTKVECLCGGSYTNCHKAEHFKCARHKNYEEELKE